MYGARANAVPSTLSRWYVCARDPLLCWHPWLAALLEIRGGAWAPHVSLFTLSANAFTTLLRAVLLQIGVTAEEAATYSTHCFRRGAGTDVLEAQPIACEALGGKSWAGLGAYGLQGMLNMGEWVAKSSLKHYASEDEQASATMAYHVLDGSDDDAD